MRAGAYLLVGAVLSPIVKPMPPASAGQISWTYQVIDPRPKNGGVVGISIGEGAHWPKAFYTVDSESSLYAAGLSPAGWLPQRLGFYGRSLSVISKPGPGGRVGAAWMTDDRIQFVQSSSSGFTSSTVARYETNNTSRPDLAWMPGNVPLVAYSESGRVKVATFNGNSWDSETVAVNGTPVTGQYVSTAVDAEHYVGVAYSLEGALYLAMKDFYSRDWQVTPVATVNAGNPMVSLAFGPDNRPAITYFTPSGELRFSTFDIQTGLWQSSSIAANVENWRVNLVFNSQGHPAVAYSSGTAIHYAVNDGNGWADYALPTGIMTDPLTGPIQRSPYGTVSPSLAFDADDVPVIAYNTSSGLVLAYDPVMPEPATSLLALAGALVLLRPIRKRERRPA